MVASRSAEQAYREGETMVSYGSRYDSTSKVQAENANLNVEGLMTKVGADCPRQLSGPALLRTKERKFGT